MTATIDQTTIWGSAGFTSREAWLADIHGKEAARVAAIRTNPDAEAVLDMDGTWHLRDDANQYIPERDTFAWFLCDEDEQAVRIIDNRQAQKWFTMTPWPAERRCVNCWPQPTAAPEWLLEGPMAEDEPGKWDGLEAEARAFQAVLA